MFNKGKNQFIGRRTGKNIIPEKKAVRVDKDGLEVFQDYFTDSEGENSTCYIAKKHVAEHQVSSTVAEVLDENNSTSSPVKTIVTDTIEIETKEVVFNASNSIVGTKENFSQKITIQCIDEDITSPDSSSPPNFNHSKINSHPEILQCDSGIYQSENQSEKSSNDKSPTPLKSLKTPKKNTTPVKHADAASILNAIDFEIGPPVDENALNETINSILNSSDLNQSKRNKRKAESNTSSELKESDKSSEIKENKNRKKALKKSSKKAKSTKSNLEKNGRSNNLKNEQELHVIHEEDDSNVHHSPKKICLSTQSNANIQPGDNKHASKKSQKAHMNNLEMNVTGSRRSLRQRHPPLKFWSNERLQYRYTESGQVECLGIVRDSKGDQLNYEKLFPKKKKPAVERIVKPRKIVEPAKSYVEKGVTVFDYESKEDVVANIIVPFDAIEWRSPKGQPLGKTFEVGKSFMLDHAAFGFLRLAPHQTKPMQYLPGYAAIFVVITGKVEVCIHHTSMILNEKDTFYLPKENGYSVTNLLDSVALLNFMTSSDSYLNELKKGE